MILSPSIAIAAHVSRILRRVCPPQPCEYLPSVILSLRKSPDANTVIIPSPLEYPTTHLPKRNSCLADTLRPLYCPNPNRNANAHQPLIKIKSTKQYNALRKAVGEATKIPLAIHKQRENWGLQKQSNKAARERSRPDLA